MVLGIRKPRVLRFLARHLQLSHSLILGPTNGRGQIGPPKIHRSIGATHGPRGIDLQGVERMAVVLLSIRLRPHDLVVCVDMVAFGEVSLSPPHGEVIWY